MKYTSTMKISTFLLFIIVCKFAFSQSTDKNSTIKVKKIASDTICNPTILGFSGDKYITRNEMLKAKKIELNKNCNYEIMSFKLSYDVRAYDSVTNLNLKSDTFNLENIFGSGLEMHLIKFSKIMAKDKNSGKEIQLPIIIFRVTE